MSKDSKRPTLQEAEQVADYLRQHMDFFLEQDELLMELMIPHRSGTAVSLVERQLTLLRERNEEMRQRLNHLMDIARENDRLFEKTRHLVLDLLDTSCLEDVVSTVEDSLRHAFNVEHVSLILFSDTPLDVGRSVPLATAYQHIGGLLASDKPVCGTFRSHELCFLFGENAADEIGSAAITPLSSQGLYGVLAIGSHDPRHYKSTSGTLFLEHIAEVLARVLPRYATALRSVR